MPSLHSASQRWVVVGVLFAVAPVISFILWQTTPGVLEENHIIESSQAILLLAAVFIHIYWSRQAIGSDGTAVAFHLTLALLCLSLFAREVDVDQLGAHAVWPAVELVFRILIVLLWIFLAIYLLRRRGELWSGRFRLMFGRASCFAYGGVFLYVVSRFFDKRVFPLGAEPSLYIEETLQLQATILFAFGALLFPLSHDRYSSRR